MDIRKEIQFEHAFVKAGGRLVAGADPTGNGAEQLGLVASIGSITNGKQADLVVIAGNPMTRIADVENVKLVFKDGVGFDSASW